MNVWYVPLAFWLWTHEDKEKEDELFFNHFLRKGDTVVDCGAHLGTLTMTAAKIVGNAGKVIACEVHPRTFSYLYRNIKKNNMRNVTCINTAIGDKKGTVSITDEYVSDLNHITKDGCLTVPITTLDTITENIAHIRLLKLDIEGYELQALREGNRTLLKVDAIYFESAEGSFSRYGYTLKDVIVFLKHNNFSCFLVDTAMNYIPIDENHVTKTRYENILALKQ
jgi:FkbM family methyltransferase